MSESNKDGWLFMGFISLIVVSMIVSLILGMAVNESSMLHKLAKDKKICNKVSMMDGTNVEKCFIVVEQYVVGK